MDKGDDDDDWSGDGMGDAWVELKGEEGGTERVGAERKYSGGVLLRRDLVGGGDALGGGVLVREMMGEGGAAMEREGV